MAVAEPQAGMPGLGARMIRAGGWLLGSNMASQALRLFSSLVLTRLLVPEAFGLVAVVQTLYLALVMFSDLGVWQSVVTSPRGCEPRFLGTAMSVQLGRGVLLALVVILLAAGLHVAASHAVFAAGTVYTDQRLPWMIGAFALCALLQGAESMHLATVQRALRTGLLVRLELLSQLSGLVVTIGLALATRSVWSLVAGSLTACASRTVLSHGILPGVRVRPCWDAACAREIVGFGKWIFLSSMIGFAAAHGEKLLLGGTLSGSDFGVYSISATLLVAVTGLVGSLNAHLVFPSLSEALRTGYAESRRVYVRVQQLADGFLGFCAGFIYMAGAWVVHLLYDQRYAQAGWMLQLLGLSLLAIRYQVLEQMMFARAQPAWVTVSNALRAMCLVLSIPVGYAYGSVHGALLAVLLSQFAGWPLALVFKYRQGLLSLRSEVVWPIALVAGLCAGWLFDKLLRLMLAA